MSATKPLVAILTGNSNSGSSCIKELFDRYADKLRVRGVFRSEEKAKPFRSNYPNLEVVTGVDASKPETLKKAFERADYALIVTPHDPTQGFSNDANLTETMINHAVENGIKYVVLVGSWTVKDAAAMSIISNRFVSSEKLLEKLSGENRVKWTVLRGGYFMENLLNENVKQSVGKDSTFNYPKAFVPMVDTRDIGKSAAACFAAAKNEQHYGKKYEMNGPELLTGEDIARIMGKVLGKTIKYNELPRDMLRKLMPLPIAEIGEYMADNGKSAVPFTQDVKNLTGQSGTTLETFLNEHKSFFN